MKKTTRPSFSDNVLNFPLPGSWEQLTQEQLRYVFFVLSRFTSSAEAKTCILVRLAGIEVIREKRDGWLCRAYPEQGHEVVFFIETWQMQSFIRQLDFLDTPPSKPTYIDSVEGFGAVNGFLRGVPFKDYLMLENHYQGYLQTKDERRLLRISELLYVNDYGRHPYENVITPEVRLSSFLWMVSVKQSFRHFFPYLFRPAEGDGGDYSPLAAMNAQIRALTGGDVTKEREVMSMDCWRALTELNEKAREKQEFDQKYGRK